MNNLKGDLDKSRGCSSSEDIKSMELWTVRQFCSAYRWPSESAMRAYIHKAKDLGIEDAFVRVGHRVLVYPNKFFALIKEAKSPSKKYPRG